MRKIVIFLFGLILVISYLSKNGVVLIPDKAIRIRIIANSNDIKDQKNKIEIKNEIDGLLYEKLAGINSYKEAKNVIYNNIENIRKIIGKYTDSYEIAYGNNYFPEKEYKGVNYKAGKYESLVVKLGEGKGNNFWCVLFPPLCMIDETKIGNISYKFYVSELLKKIK